MPGKILGLDLSDEAVTAVQVKSGLKGHQVIACARVTLGENNGLEGALKQLFEGDDFRSDLCFASIPADQASYRNLNLPFGDPKKIRQTLQFEIETMVPYSVEDLVIDFTVNERSGQNEILAVSVKKSFIAEYLSHLQPHGIIPDFLDIRCMPILSWLVRQEETPAEGLFLDIGRSLVTMAVFLNRRVILIRTFSFEGGALAQSTIQSSEGEEEAQPDEQIESSFKALCTKIQNTIHASGWQINGGVHLEKVFFTGVGARYRPTEELLSRFLDLPTEKVDLSDDKRVSIDENITPGWDPALMEVALALTLRDTRRSQGFNFRKGEFERERQYFWPKKELRKAAVFLIIVLGFLSADQVADYHLMKKRYETLNRQITEVFKKAVPEVTRIVDPVQQMKVKINEMKKSAVAIPGISENNKVIDLLKDISERVPQALDVHLTRMVIEPETVRISGRTDTFNTVDSIKSGLDSSAYFSGVTISSANLDRTGKQVQFEIKLERGKSQS